MESQVGKQKKRLTCGSDLIVQTFHRKSFSLFEFEGGWEGDRIRKIREQRSLALEYVEQRVQVVSKAILLKPGHY